MMIQASTEKTAAELSIWKTYNESYWTALRLVGWIGQNDVDLKTTLYFKWQVGADNYFGFWNDAHEYTVNIGDSYRYELMSLPKATNEWVDITPTRSITVSHESDGTFSGTLHVSGYKYWEYFSDDISIEFPTIVTPEEPEPTPTPGDQDREGVPIVNTRNPRFYILSDGQVIYASNRKDRSVTNAKLTLELSQTDSLDFTVTAKNAMFDGIDKLRSTIEVLQGSEVLFRGRVLDDQKDFNNSKDVHAEGALAFLSDTLMAPYEEGRYTDAKTFFKAILETHSTQVPSSTPYRKLRYVRCNVTDSIEVSNDDYSYSSEALSSIMDLGGYLKLEYYSDGTTGLSLLNSYEHTSAQPIEFGKNLLDLKIYVSTADIYTSVVCLGAKDEETGERLTTGTGANFYVEDQDAINKFGRIIRHFEYDDITDVETLRQTAAVLLLLGLRSEVTIEAKAFDLHLVNPDIEKIRLGDAVYARSVPHGLDGYYQVSKIDLDLLNPENTVFTFGATVKSLTDFSKNSGK